ncbi:MAG: IS1595 family transposase [Stellaceae bacterium]
MNLHELTKIAGDEAKAFQMIESLVWPNGPTCPHCGATDRINRLGVQKSKPSKKHPEGKPVYGLWKCYNCRGQFTARKNTIFEDSAIPLGKWLIAIFMMCASKKGVSAMQLSRQLGLGYKASWFMCFRVREAMALPPLKGMLGGGSNNIVEVDETYIGAKAGNNPHKGRKPQPKAIVMTLIERGGNVYTQPVKNVRSETLKGVVLKNVAETAHIMTDEAGGYQGLRRRFASHQTVNHGKEYVRGVIHTNFAESYHSLLKRGIFGTFHHVSKQHLPRYLNEFSFRWNNRKINDGERAEQAIRQVVGRRLRYQTPVKRGSSSLA